MKTAATALTGTHEHIDAYAALHMDPNAEECTVASNLVFDDKNKKFDKGAT